MVEDISRRSKLWITIIFWYKLKLHLWYYCCKDNRWSKLEQFLYQMNMCEKCTWNDSWINPLATTDCIIYAIEWFNMRVNTRNRSSMNGKGFTVVFVSQKTNKYVHISQLYFLNYSLASEKLMVKEMLLKQVTVYWMVFLHYQCPRIPVSRTWTFNLEIYIFIKRSYSHTSKLNSLGSRFHHPE